MHVKMKYAPSSSNSLYYPKCIQWMQRAAAYQQSQREPASALFHSTYRTKANKCQVWVFMQEVYFRGREQSKFRAGLNWREEAEEFPFYNHQSKRKLSVHLGSIWQLPCCQTRRAQGNPHVEIISPSSPFPWHLVSNMFVHLIADIC